MERPRELHVANLTSRVTREHLHEIFATYGTVGAITLHQSVITKKFYAYIELSSGTDEALSHLDEGIIDGKIVRVSYKTNQNGEKVSGRDNIKDRRANVRGGGFDAKRDSKYPRKDSRDNSRGRDRRYRGHSSGRRRNRDSRDNKDSRDRRNYNHRGRSNSRDNYTRRRSRSRSDSRQRKRYRSSSPSSYSRSRSPSLVRNRGRSFSRSRSRSPNKDIVKQRELIQNLLNIQNEK